MGPRVRFIGLLLLLVVGSSVAKNDTVKAHKPSSKDDAKFAKLSEGLTLQCDNSSELAKKEEAATVTVLKDETPTEKPSGGFCPEMQSSRKICEHD